MALRRSIESDPVVPLALELSSLPAAIHEELWDSLELEQAPERSSKALESALADRDATLRLLQGFPAFALLVLEAICDARGSIERRDLERALAEQTGDSKAVVHGIEYVVGHGLALTSGLGPRDHITLIAPRARLVAELVLGLSTPSEVPPEPPSDPELLDHERNVLAMAALAGHRKLKWTLDGRPNKASLKTFARGLGADEARVESLLLDAWKAGLIVEQEDGPVEPDAAALRRAARRGPSPPAESLLGTIDARLPEEGWLPARTLLPSVRAFGIATSRELMARSAGRFVFREHEGHLFVGRPTRPSLRTGDGHVTPSFEAMLGPGAHPEVAVIIGLFAELVRLDRVLTFKISEASVHAGLRSGFTIDEFQEALAATGRHGVPENVSITVRDFAARVSTIRAAWALQVPAGAVPALQRELGEAFLGTPAPGLVLASSLVSEADIAVAMAAAGLKPLAVRDNDPGSEGRSSAPARASLEPAKPDATLRARVDVERKEGFGESLRALVEARPRFDARPGRDAERVAEEAVARATPGVTPPLTRVALERLRELIRGVPRELEPWIARLSPGRASEARRAVRDPGALVPFASLPHEARNAVLQRARSWGELDRYCDDALLRGALRPEAARLLAAFRGHAGGERGEDAFDAGTLRLSPGPHFERDVRRLVKEEAVVALALRKGTTVEKYNVAVTSLIKRGSELVLLAEDLDADENHVFPLSKIAWIDFEEVPPDDFEAIYGLGHHPNALAESAHVRNDSCPCGSGKKYDRCHGAN